MNQQGAIADGPMINAGGGGKMIAIMDGIPRGFHGKLSGFLQTLLQELPQHGYKTCHLPLDSMSISGCRGCRGCWTKTPGECILEDDGGFLCRQMLRSDLAILASPIIAGFPSSILKNAQERLIPLIHPYTTIIDGEIHHRPRYSRFPRIALLLEPLPDTDEEDLSIIKKIYHRDAVNFHTALTAVWTTELESSEVIHEIDRH